VRRRAALAAIAAGVLLAAAAPAQAATLAVSGSKSCYRAGDTLSVTGTGFTPSAPVSFTLDNGSLGQLTADAAGNVSSSLRVGRLRGVRRRTLIATDATNPANVATAQFLGSALSVSVRPKNGRAGRRLRVAAAGFTTGRRLYAHVYRRGYRHNVFVTRLKGPCRTGKARRRIVPASAPPGVYKVQFDTRRRLSPKTRVWVRFNVTVTRG
jgi:hypothetical protein